MSPLLNNWLAQSRKAWIGLVTVILTVTLNRVLPKLGFDIASTKEITGNIVFLAIAWIGAIAIEDHGKNSAPIQQNNTDSNVVNAAPPVASAPGIAKAFDDANKGAS